MLTPPALRRSGITPVFTFRPADVATFETSPRNGLTDPAGPAPARSLAELSLGELRDHRASASHAVTLDDEASLFLVSVLLAATAAAAHRTAGLARDRAETIGGQVHEILLSKQFRKGSRDNYPWSLAEQTIKPFVDRGEPIRVMTFGFPAKLDYNGLKTAGPLPDFGELAALARFGELQRAVRRVYPPGLHIMVLSDGNHFRPRPTELLRPYQAKLAEFQELVGTDVLTVHDLDALAMDRLGADPVAERLRAVGRHVQTITATLDGIDVTRSPLRALEKADRRLADGTGSPSLAALFRSLVYAVTLPPAPRPMRPQDWARQLYVDVFDVTDPVLGKERGQVLSRAWTDAIRYLAAIRADREVAYEEALVPRPYVRLSPHPRPGTVGFGYLGGSCMLPWHGVGLVGTDGIVSSGLAISAADAGYVPVRSALMGTDQPWFLAPVTATHKGKLNPALVASLRLRRR
ncbi:L-tyrosine/L-tryptophan isonitrile synthase family protein [Fodinicola feengrottensis]|uniref:L-tyrosine/L-tryptophan isonitrile synthase family protein n=1 Tax=Fodinicola feengrottensis TaxID=435914 RepID=UPI0013D0D7F0|nr:L-tyrosine/L-tryptophan isonitrile synthase family protein [Fodinicola feengrottensis]